MGYNERDIHAEKNDGAMPSGRAFLVQCMPRMGYKTIDLTTNVRNAVVGGS